MDIENNQLINKLPKHLKQFIRPQSYENYTPIDHSVWRYIMRKNTSYLPSIAHHSYLNGLNQTGIEIEKIPSISAMNQMLKRMGWAAVAVDGFIPPNAFMEFQEYKVLVIATDIRALENISYTPAPDIIHEAAGHAPIIINPDYAEYLRRLGAIGAKAILSKHDVELYEASRTLSILKSNNNSCSKKIEEIEENINNLLSKNVELSEMAQIKNLQWWTVEYGLIGSINNPKVYGAGLLSSISESRSFMDSSVKKIEFSIDAAKQGFDITKPQPQLYVTPDFSYLMEVLEEFANTLSLRRGGSKSILKLIESQMVGTIELNTGLQISGKFSKVFLNEDGEAIFFKTEGKTALAYREKELVGHGTLNHPNGFSSPLGKLKKINLPIEDMGPYDLKAYNFYDGKWLSLEYESGIKVQGMNITGIRNIQGKLMLIQLKDCTVTYNDQILFKPEYGTFDLALGNKVISAYAGAADQDSFTNLYNVSITENEFNQKDNSIKELEKLYQFIRSFREKRTHAQIELYNIFEIIKEQYSNEWLLILELYELTENKNLKNKLHLYLIELSIKFPHLENLIKEGIKLSKNKV